MNEFIVNLWAVYDAETRLVYALSGKVYCVSGDERFKLKFLKLLSQTDYLTAKRYQVPSRFRVSFADGSTKNNVTLLNTVTQPEAQLFDDVFNNLEAALPRKLVIKNMELVEINQSLPDDPICVVTTLYEDRHGNITPVVNDSDREWVRKQERMRGH